MKLQLQNDKIFYTELSLGTITTVRSILMRDLMKTQAENAELFQSALKVLDRANDLVYRSKLPLAFLEQLIVFINEYPNTAGLTRAINFFSELCNAESQHAA